LLNPQSKLDRSTSSVFFFERRAFAADARRRSLSLSLLARPVAVLLLTPPLSTPKNQPPNNKTPNKTQKQDKKKKWEPPAPPPRVGKKQRRRDQAAASAGGRLPTVTPNAKCKLRLLKLERIKDYLLMEHEFVARQEAVRPADQRQEEERGRVDDLRGSPLSVGTLEEIVDESHAIVSSAVGPEYYVGVLSFVDRAQLEPGSSVLLHHKAMAVVGILADEADPMVSVMKVEKAPLESYADVGGLEPQIQEIKEAVELPLTHPELYEDIGIKPPKGVILYGEPGTGKTLLAKAVANSTSATFLRVVGSELIQKYLGDGPKLVRELFRVADELAPSIVFIDEIDAVGTKRYDSTSGGEREIQRTMLELLNQMDGFDALSEVKVIMATNRIDTLDPALIRPGRIDRKIEFPLPDAKTKRRIFGIHTGEFFVVFFGWAFLFFFCVWRRRRRAGGRALALFPSCRPLSQPPSLSLSSLKQPYQHNTTNNTQTPKTPKQQAR
jgi:26S proteasome regulatory subunit T2